MENIDELEFEQRKFYVSTDEFQKKTENFQKRFQSNERANKRYIIGLLIVSLIVIILVVVVGYLCFSIWDKNEIGNVDRTSLWNALKKEEDMRKSLERVLTKEKEKRMSLEKVVTQTYSLLGGSNAKEGDIYVNGRPVCDDDWDLDDATVACKSLGFKKAVNFTTDSAFGSVADNFIMDNVNCAGTEASLLICDYSKKENCGAIEGAGVVCD